MNTAANLGICFVPPILAATIFLLCHKKATLGSAVLSILSGLAATVPIALIQLLVFSLPVFSSGSIIMLFLASVLFNGLIAETIKMFLLMLIPGKEKKPLLFVICAIIAGISAGSFETTAYYLIYGTEILSMRFPATLLINAFCSGLSGLYVWSFKNRKQYIRPFLAAILLHGIYNFFAGFLFPIKLFAYVAILYTIIRLKFSYDRLTNKDYDDIMPINYDAG